MRGTDAEIIHNFSRQREIKIEHVTMEVYGKIILK
jgi:hypothetical protein